VAASGDVIDLTQISCGLITLTTGAIVARQASLELRGPGPERLQISGNSTQWVLDHEGTGRLTVTGLLISDGLNEQDYKAYGGCVYSAAFLTLERSEVQHCVAHATSAHNIPIASGGGAFAQRGLDLIDTSMLDNSVIGGDVMYPIAEGGAIGSNGPMSIVRSYIARNYSSNLGGGIAGWGLVMIGTLVTENDAPYVGGVTAFGDITIDRSAIVNNTSSMYGGLVVGTDNYTHASVRNTTISGNSGALASGVTADRGNVAISNCTIAFNTTDDARGAVGLYNRGASVDLESSIVADNTWLVSDGSRFDEDISGADTIVGSSNLVIFSEIPLPEDTRFEDPLLEPLGYNGGPTPTHGLSLTSPAIDAGNNSTGAQFDQRGIGYTRVVGGSADIGAFELNVDEILADGFDD